MEATIKQAEEERGRAMESAKKLYEEYRPLKEEVDHLRAKFGLQPLTELQEEDEKLRPEYYSFFSTHSCCLTFFFNTLPLFFYSLHTSHLTLC